MLNANCLLHFNEKKRKLNTHLLFSSTKVNKQYTAEPQEAIQVEESEKDYKRLPQEKEKQEEEIQSAENQLEELPIAPPKIGIPP